MRLRENDIKRQGSVFFGCLKTEDYVNDEMWGAVENLRCQTEAQQRGKDCDDLDP